METKVVTSMTVACDGGVAGHPRVFLNLGDDGEVVCPYCGCRYVLEGRPPGNIATDAAENGAGTP